MLEIIVPLVPEMWDEQKEEFIPPVTQTLQLEHSLVSLKEWESKWCKPFLTKQEKTPEETIDYIKQMTINDVEPYIYDYLTTENMKQIEDYISAPMTATTFSKEPRSSNREQVTAELIYYWMISLNIPSEYQYWHLNSLLTLIRVCNVKNTPPKRMGKRALMSRNAALNAARRQQLNSKG